MKKYLKLTLVVLLTLLFVVPSSVNAEETTTTSWNQNIKTDYFDITISDLRLAIYTTEEVEVEDKEDDGVTVEGSYEEKTLYKTVPLSKENHTMVPTHLYYPGKETEEEKEGNTTLIKLGLDLTSDQIKQYVKSVIPTEGAEDSYYIELIIDFKLNKYPEYKNIYRTNIYESLVASIKNEQAITKYDPTKTISIPVNAASYFVENGVETVEYITEITTDEQKFGILFANSWFILFSDQGCEDVSCSNVDEGDAIIFTTINNYEKLVEDSESLEEEVEDKIEEELNQEKPVEETQKTEVVEVDDTASSFPVDIYLIGVTIILLGSFIIYKVIQKKAI